MVCEPGTNRVNTGATSAAQCDQVAHGSYSNTIIGYGSSATMNVTECDPGYYCINGNKQGSNAGQACEPGYFCSGGNQA
jgi:hypothetical protein